ncbi:MAG: hypothetical protein K0M47_25830 [Rhizobium sp.]|nr:hypothetical protein [Rhizobium sp.]
MTDAQIGLSVATPIIIGFAILLHRMGVLQRGGTISAVLPTRGGPGGRGGPPTAPTRQVRRSLIAAALLGFVFLAVKLFEYSGEIHYAGEETFNGFFELYFIITGFHLLHVVFGALVMLLIAWRPSRGNVALITTLWHAIDLVWIVMFPIIYLA